VEELVEKGKDKYHEEDDAQDEKDYFARIEALGETVKESHESSLRAANDFEKNARIYLFERIVSWVGQSFRGKPPAGTKRNARHSKIQ
jgi:hypothetical protein